MEEYRWVQEDDGFDAYCVTVVRGASIDDVIDAFACDRASRVDAPFAAQRGMSAPYPEGWGNDTIQVDTLDGAIVCLEDNGWAGTEDPRPGRLSTSGGYTAVFRNVNAVMQVVTAEAGHIRRRFDPLLYEAEGAIAEEEDLPFGDPELATLAMWVLLERLTGLRLSRGWVLDQPHPAYRRDPDGTVA
jgi:uncharacterized protein DUF6461